MKIPAIEELIEQVADSRTKESLDEVLSSFYSGNMRSAVVMLYATVVSDVYYKICDLVNLYNDNGAKLILDYVDKEWKRNKTSAMWETEMPKKCHESNKVFNNVSYAHFCNLQTQRNLCAHPNIDAMKGLYKPNRATVQGLIIELMEGVLCKPPFLSKDFFDVFTDDIENSSDSFPDSKGLCAYINAKYLEKIDNEVEEYGLFKKLWKLVFKKTDDRSNKNRHNGNAVLDKTYDEDNDRLSIEISNITGNVEIVLGEVHYKPYDITLKIEFSESDVLDKLLTRNSVFFVETFKKDADYYAVNVNLEDKNCVDAYIRFANLHRDFYKNMPEHFKLAFNEKVNKDEDYKAKSFCLNDDVLAHAKNIHSGISYKTAKYSYNYMVSVGEKPEALDFCIRMYGTSSCYNDADDYFESLIAPNIHKMTEEQLKKLVEYSNTNNQIYDRRKASSAKHLIKEYMGKKNPDFDYAGYEHFN